MMMRAFFAAMLSWVSVAHGQGFLGAGVDTNAVVVVTSNTTVNATHCGKTIEAGTGSTGFFTLTLPGISGLPTNCVAVIKNGDTARGKLLSGFPSDIPNILWPSQTLKIGIVNGAWATLKPQGRWLAQSQIVLNTNHGSGSDTNNDCLGTGSGACATLAGAIAILTNQIDCGGNTPHVSNAASETFTENVVVLGPPCGGGHTNLIQFDGNGSTWQPSGVNGVGLTCFDLAMCIVNNFAFTSSASGQTAL
jgi:hypothetical protein